MNVIARLEYELAYYDSAVHRFNHYTTRTPPHLIEVFHKKMSGHKHKFKHSTTTECFFGVWVRSWRMCCRRNEMEFRLVLACLCNCQGISFLLWRSLVWFSHVAGPVLLYGYLYVSPPRQCGTRPFYCGSWAWAEAQMHSKYKKPCSCQCSLKKAINLTLSKWVKA